ncbi:hypothetical protein HK097_006030, partial [Rhizophlyctis rosea]
VDTELGYVFDAITLTRTKLAGRVPLFGFVGAPWTLMAYMIEGGGSRTLSKAKSWLFNHPEESKQLLQRVTDVCVDFLVGQVKAGAQLLQVFDSWGGELSPHQFSQFSLPYLLQIPPRVRAALKKLDPTGKTHQIPIVCFARNAHYALEALSDRSQSDYDILSLDWTLDPKEAKRRTGGRVVLQGNADPAVLYASKEVIEREVEEMVKAFDGRERYIANLGHGMHPDHDPERLGWYLKAIKDVSTKLNKA